MLFHSIVDSNKLPDVSTHNLDHSLPAHNYSNRGETPLHATHATCFS